MHASNTAARRAKVHEASDGIEAVKKELGTGRLYPETIIFAEGQGSALILPTYLPVSTPSLPCRGGRNWWQSLATVRKWLATLIAVVVAVGCGGSHPLCSTSAPYPLQRGWP